MSEHGDAYRGLKKGYRVIFTFPSTKKLYSMLLAWGVAEAYLYPKSILPILVVVVVAHTLILVDHRIFTAKRVAGLTLYTLAVMQPAILTGNILYAVSAASLISAVIAATLRSPYMGVPYAAAALIAAAARPESFILAAAMLALIVALLRRVDNRIRRAVGASGIRLLNAFFHYILASRKDFFEEELSKLASEKTLTLHAYRVQENAGPPILDIIVSEIHPGPFRDVGSSVLPQLLMKRPVPTLFLKAPATHSENLASSRDSEKAAALVAERLGAPGLHSIHGGIASVADGLVDATLLYWDSSPPLLLLEPQIPLEDLPRSLIDELSPAVPVDAHSIIDKEYLVLKENTALYVDVLAEVKNLLYMQPPLGEVKAAATRIEYTDGVEVAPGGITLALIEAGGEKTLVVCIDGNNMNPAFHSKLKSLLEELADHVVLATTDTHLYSGAFSGVEYKPVGSTTSSLLAEIITGKAEMLMSQLKPAAVSYTPVPVRARYLDGEALEKVSLETEKNLRDGAKIFLLVSLYPTLLLLLQDLRYLLPILVNHALYLLHVLSG